MIERGDQRPEPIDNGFDKDAQHLSSKPASSSLRGFVTLLFKRKKMILSVFVLIALGVTVATFLMPPVYRASVKVLVEKDGSSDKSLLFRLNLPPNVQGYDWIKSEMEIVSSYPVVSRLLKQLGSDDYKPAEQQGPERDLQFEKAVKRFHKRLSVDNARNSNVIAVSYESKDAQLAATTANRLIQYYLDHRSAIHDQSDAYEFFEEQMRVAEAKLQELEHRLSDYKNEQEIIAPETQGKILLAKLSDYQKGLTNVQTRRIGKEAKLSVIINQLEREELTSIPSTDVSDSPSREKYIAELKGELLRMEIQRDRLLQRFKPTYEEIVQLEQQILATKDIIRNEIQEIVEQEKTAIKALVAEERSLQESILEINQQIRALAQKEYEFSQLNRGIDDNQEVYSMLLKQREEARLSLAKIETGVRVKVISPAVVPQKPIKPRKRLNVVLGVLLGAAAGVGLAFFVERNDQTVSNNEDLERLTGLKALGSIREIV